MPEVGDKELWEEEVCVRGIVEGGGGGRTRTFRLMSHHIAGGRSRERRMDGCVTVDGCGGEGRRLWSAITLGG